MFSEQRSKKSPGRSIPAEEIAPEAVKLVAKDHETGNSQSDERTASGTVNLAEYRIGDLLGKGGMGAVFRAHHSAIDKTVAVKFLHKELAVDPVNLARFRQEVKAASLLTHANLAAVYDSGVADDGTPYMVMDYLDGKTLDEVLTTEGSLGVDRFLDIFIQVTEALVHAHSKGVVHRDLKPSNIMLLDSDLVKVVDFGIARVLERSKEATQNQLTQTGAVLGSPIYMSPEQCLGRAVDEKSDLYSLAAVMYHALTGSQPFDGESPVEIIVQHVHDKPKAPIKAGSTKNLPPELEELILSALDKSPDKRPQSAEEFLESLLMIRDWHNGTRSRPLLSTPKRIVRKLDGRKTIAIVLLSLAGVLCLVYAINQSHQPNPLVAQPLGPMSAPPVESPPVESPPVESPPVESPPEEAPPPQKTASGFVIKNVRDRVLFKSTTANTLEEALQQACKKHIPLHNAALYEARISGVDLSGIDLSDADLRGAQLDDVQLNGAHLANVDLNGGRLTAVEMAGADLANTSLTNLQASQCNFDRAKMKLTETSSSSFVNCSFQEALLYCVNIQQSQFRNCNFDKATLDRCTFGVIDGCTFISSKLINADFSRAFQVTACDFTDAKITLKGKPSDISRDNNINDGFLDQ